MEINIGELRNKFPVRVRAIGQRFRKLLHKPTLNYVELHLTDHCNLNCRGCGHFSPLADKWFADIHSHERDMKRLSRLFKNVKRIRLMGGEPLLHPQVSSFIDVTGRYLPNAGIRLVTNGLLLSKMDMAFWRACKNSHITIDLTLYPVTLDIDRIRHLTELHEVKLQIVKATEFFAGINLRGDSDPIKAMSHCRAHMFCPFLKEGKIYSCSLPALAGYFNRVSKTTISTTDFVDIHERNMTGWKILEFIDKPSESCRYCGYEYRAFPWARSGRQTEEWTV